MYRHLRFLLIIVYSPVSAGANSILSMTIVEMHTRIRYAIAVQLFNATELNSRRGHRARQAHRRDAHRHQCALYRGGLRGRPRRAVEALRQISERASRPAVFPTIRAVCAAPAAAAASWQQARRRRFGKTRRVLLEDIYNKKGQMLHGTCPFRQYSYLFSGTPRSSARMARKRSGTASSRIFLTTPRSFAVSPTG